MIRFRSRFSRFSLGWLAVLIFFAREAGGAVYEVGAERRYKCLQDVTGLVKSGDVVRVDGGITYAGGVTLGENGGNLIISIIGRRVNGLRPVLSGVTKEGSAVLRVLGNHYLIEGFDLTAGGDARAARCFYNVGDDVTLRDCAVHDCRSTGIAGSDVSGSLTLDRVEVYHCGNGLYAHQIYVGSSLAKYPRALFRMQYCYVHDGAGGNNVKSRVTRNEIEYSWIEGAAYHELDLVGPDPKAQKTPPGGVHCDGDIVGNVLVVTGSSRGTVARLGSDGTASSRGRYRFVNNTVIVRAKGAAGFGLFWLEGEVDSVGLWNNVFWSDVGPMAMVRQEAGTAPVMEGAGNWAPEGTARVPPGWKGVRGKDPGFLDADGADYRPAAGSPLIGGGCVPPVLVTGVPREGGVRGEERAKDIGAWPFSGGN